MVILSAIVVDDVVKDVMTVPHNRLDLLMHLFVSAKVWKNLNPKNRSFLLCDICIQSENTNFQSAVQCVKP